MRTKTPSQAEKILKSAELLFGEHRFHEVRMEDIAAEAEVGKGTLYRYFHDKEELYLALLARASEKFVGRIAECTGRESCPRLRLERLVQASIEFFDEHPHLLDLIQRAEVMRPTGTPFPWQQARQQTSELVTRLFADAEAQGVFRVRNPEIAVWMLLGGVRGIIRFGTRPRPADLAERVVQNFLNGAHKGDDCKRG